MANPLTEIIPAEARKGVYAAFALVGLALSGTQVWFVAVEAGQPVWLTGALAVYVFVAGALGFTTAASNTHPEQPRRDN